MMPSPPEQRDHESVHASTWIDIEQRSWRVDISPQRIVLRSESGTIDLPSDAWARDLYVSGHGGGHIVRVETFQIAARFLLTPDQAAPLLAVLGGSITEPVSPAVATAMPDSEPERPKPLLWPRVSPLAVWAVICSSLVFVPGLGWLCAAATITLLIRHRRTVRSAAAWRHSRQLCVVAFILLIYGLAVSAVAAWGFWRNLDTLPEYRFLPYAEEARNWGVLAGGIFVVLLSLTIHEAAHAVTAWWLGDGLARSLGRVTLNPLAHIDPFGTVLLPLMLAWAGAPVFGYARPVPVELSSVPHRHRAHILVSLAGPGSNLLLAAASLSVLLLLGCAVSIAAPHAQVTNFAALDFTLPVKASGFVLAPVFGAICTILKLSFFINTLLAVFNLIPIPPLDGSWVLEHFFPATLGEFYAKMRPYGFIIFLGMLWMGVLDDLLMPVLHLWRPAMSLLEGATGW